MSTMQMNNCQNNFKTLLIRKGVDENTMQCYYYQVANNWRRRVRHLSWVNSFSKKSFLKNLTVTSTNGKMNESLRAGQHDREATKKENW